MRSSHQSELFASSFGCVRLCEHNSGQLTCHFSSCGGPFGSVCQLHSASSSFSGATDVISLSLSPSRVKCRCELAAPGGGSSIPATRGQAAKLVSLVRLFKLLQLFFQKFLITSVQALMLL